MERVRHSDEYTNHIETPRAMHINSIHLKNGESINIQQLLKSIEDNSMKAVNQLPVNQSVKQKILEEIGIIPYDFKKIKSIHKIGRQRISAKNRGNLNVV